MPLAAPLIGSLAPLLGGGGGKPPPHGGERKEGSARREALLLALKPYLSPERCDAIDYLLRLARVGEAIRALQ